jgi:hypothetical protein
MEIKNRNVFWEALILAIFIFAIGVFLGYLIEMNRTSKILTLYQQSELDLLDVQIQKDILSFENINCGQAFKEIIDFANRVYEQAFTLEKYEESSRLTDGLKIQHKKYDLLRVVLWMNALKFKETCKQENTSIIVYFYEYLSESQDKKSMQEVFSRKLGSVKDDFGEKVLLIPIAGNINSNSINYLKTFYNITYLPSILINEKIKITTTEEIKDIESYLD